MQIAPKALIAIIPHQELKHKKLNIGAVVVATRRHFCSPMTAYNLCTKECSNCAAAILKAANNIEKAAKPYGMYVAGLRHAAADAAEAQVKPAIEKKTDALGIPVDSVDAFADLLAELL